MTHKRSSEKHVKDRFWSKVEFSDGCWVWKGSARETGYGQFNNEGKIVKAHRLAYEWIVGPIADGLYVCHHCDNRLCVRPDHLFLGTAKENMQDCVRKGRLVHVSAKGEDGGSAKLTWEQVREIRNTYASGGISQPALAREYGVVQGTISNILLHKTWKEA